MKLGSTKGQIGSMLSLHQPPAVLRDALLSAHTFDNPVYLQALKYSKWGAPKRIPPKIQLAYEDGDTLFVPRGCTNGRLTGLARSLWNCIKWSDNRATAPAVYPASKVVCSQEQRLLLDSFASDMRDSQFGMLLYIAPTGIGKTMFQALAAKMTGQRALILCLTELIKQSWYGDLEKVFGLAMRDIGIIQRDKFKIGAHFTLASVMTLAKRKEKWPELFQHFGCLVVDEADTITAPSIHEFVMTCPFKYIIGATATDYRDGKSSFYLPCIFGPVKSRLVMQQRDTLTNLALKSFDPVPTQFHYEYDSTKQLDWHRLIETVCLDEGRNLLIVKNAVKDWKDGESVLLFTRRLAHAQELLRLLKLMGVEDANLLTGETNINRVYTEKLIEGVLSRKVRMVVATTALKRGANLNPMSVLHVTLPIGNKKDLEQLVGRIRRRSSDKKSCRLVYYVDSAVPYLQRVYHRIVPPVLRKLKVPGWENRYIA